MEILIVWTRGNGEDAGGGEEPLKMDSLGSWLTP